MQRKEASDIVSENQVAADLLEEEGFSAQAAYLRNLDPLLIELDSIVVEWANSLSRDNAGWSYEVFTQYFPLQNSLLINLYRWQVSDRPETMPFEAKIGHIPLRFIYHHRANLQAAVLSRLEIFNDHRWHTAGMLDTVSQEWLITNGEFNQWRHG